MKNLGQRLIYTKWIDLKDSTKKKVSAKDVNGNSYVVEVPAPVVYSRAGCVITDKIVETREASGKTKVSYEIALKHLTEKRTTVFVIDEDSPMWQDMEILE
jgi:hypothetical protein